MLVRLKLDGLEPTEKMNQLIENYKKAKRELELALSGEFITLCAEEKEEAASGN